jgi:hypothetical protein
MHGIFAIPSCGDLRRNHDMVVVVVVVLVVLVLVLVLVLEHGV